MCVCVCVCVCVCEGEVCICVIIAFDVCIFIADYLSLILVFSM